MKSLASRRHANPRHKQRNIINKHHKRSISAISLHKPPSIKSHTIHSSSRQSSRPVSNYFSQHFSSLSSSTHNCSTGHNTQSTISPDHAFEYCVDLVKTRQPEYAQLINHLPQDQRALAYGLRALLCELDKIPENATQANLALMRGIWWADAVHRIQNIIIDDVEAHDNPHIQREPLSPDKLPPIHPVITTLSHAIRFNGVGFDFETVDTMIRSHVHLLSPKGFISLPDYINVADNHTGAMHNIILHCTLHSLYPDAQTVPDHLIHTATQLGRVEGLARLLHHQPLTLVRQYTWVPQDVMSGQGALPGHLKMAGASLLETTNKEFFDGLKDNSMVDISIKSEPIQINHMGEDDLEKTLAEMRQNDPKRSHIGYNEKFTSLKQPEPVKMSTLRTSLRETNKILCDITQEQLDMLTERLSKVPSKLKPCFYSADIAQQLVNKIKAYDYDVLHPDIRAFDHKELLSMQIKATGKNFASKLKVF